MKKFIGILLTLTIIFSLSSEVFAFDTDKVNVTLESVGNYLYKTVKEPIVGSIGGEWAVLGLARSEVDIPDEYFENYYQAVTKYIKDSGGVLHNKKYTEYSRVILALTAIGKNPKDVADYNLLTPLGDYEKTVWQGVNGAIWALIALDSRNYDMPNNPNAKIQATREMYINYILEKQTSDGGWALSGDISDPDVTGMALQALSKYQNNDKVKSATEKALNCLSNMQNENGGFSNYDVETSESSVQVLVALCELGISIDDTRFVKNGNSVLDSLLSYYCGGGFKHTISGEINQMATEQALYALVAAERMKSGKNSIYDMSDSIKISENKNTEEKVIITKTFTDIQGHKNQKAVEILCAKNIINGRSETVFDPENTVTRAEFATIIVKALDLKNKNTSVFRDVCTDDWFYLYVGAAYDNGIINGVGNNTFNPYGTITRQESAVMLSRAAAFLGINTEMDTMTARDILAIYIDYVKAPDWAIKSLAFCVNEGIIKEEGIELLSAQSVKRGETAQMIYNLLERTGKV